MLPSRWSVSPAHEHRELTDAARAFTPPARSRRVVMPSSAPALSRGASAARVRPGAFTPVTMVTKPVRLVRFYPLQPPPNLGATAACWAARTGPRLGKPDGYTVF